MKRKIGFELGRTGRLIKRAFVSSGVQEYAVKISDTHGWAIGYLYDHRNEDIFQKDFEKEFDIRRSTASKILSSMEENGLVKRISVPYDARLKKLVITEKALEIESKIREQFSAMDEKFVEGIDEEELKSFYKTLYKINKNIERNIDDDKKIK